MSDDKTKIAAQESELLQEQLGLALLNYFKRCTNQNIDIIDQFAGVTNGIEKTLSEFINITPIILRSFVKGSIIKALNEGDNNGTAK